jgi:type II secretory pathway pseudopilin PulG
MATVLTLIGVLTVLAILTTQKPVQRARASATATQMEFMRTGLAAIRDSLGLELVVGDERSRHHPPPTPTTSPTRLTRSWSDRLALTK